MYFYVSATRIKIYKVLVKYTYPFGKKGHIFFLTLHRSYNWKVLHLLNGKRDYQEPMVNYTSFGTQIIQTKQKFSRTFDFIPKDLVTR